MKVNKYIHNLLTFSFIGYLPASGTVATIFTLPVIYLFSFLNPINYILITLLLTLLAYYFINLVIKYIKNDPPEIVIDEFIGCLFTFIAIKISLKAIIFGFLFFRLFDIYKPFGIKKIETIPGAIGILFDDIAAGLISNILLQFFIC